MADKDLAETTSPETASAQSLNTDASDRSSRVAILGGGSFGTAIANIIATNGHQARQWYRDATRAQEARDLRENRHYLPGYTLHDDLAIFSDIAECVNSCEIVIISVPSHSFRDIARKIAPIVSDNAIVISTTKGIESDGFTLMSQILEQELPHCRIGVLSGPNFAYEIIRNQYTGSVIASEDEEIRARLPRILSSGTFRVYSNHDRYGVELGGALKNIYAIITGLANAMGCGQNTQAMLLTRSLAEMGRFAHKLGADAMTFLGLAGVGDLILTCTSDLSRNYRFGQAIGQGKDVDEAMASIAQVVEGVNTLKIVKVKAEELQVYMPLVAGLYAVLFEQRDLASIIKGLMSGEVTTDVEYER